MKIDYELIKFFKSLELAGVYVYLKDSAQGEEEGSKIHIPIDFICDDLQITKQKLKRYLWLLKFGELVEYTTTDEMLYVYDVKDVTKRLG